MSSEIAVASIVGTSVFTNAPDSKGAKTYADLAEEILGYRVVSLEELHQHPKMHRPVRDESVLANGASKDSLRPIDIYPDPDGGYWILSGVDIENAARLAGLTHVNCHVERGMTTEQAELAIAEGVLKDLNGISTMAKARALQFMSEAEKKGIKTNIERHSGMYRYKRLNKLIPQLQEHIQAYGKGKIGTHAGSALAKLPVELQMVVNDCIEKSV